MMLPPNPMAPGILGLKGLAGSSGSGVGSSGFVSPSASSLGGSENDDY